MKTKKYVQTFLYSLPALVFFFGQFNLAYHFLSDYSYVNGYFVNYYDFVIHIVDLSLIVSLVIIFFLKKLWRDRGWMLLFSFSFLLWIAHNLIFADAIVLYFSSRILLYYLSALSLHRFIFDLETKDRKKVAYYLTISVSISLIIQSIIIFTQFSLNHVIGLKFLGESVVQTGVSGTSSVFLPFGIFLRGYGTFPHPNIAAGYLSVGILYLLGVVLFSKKKGFNLFLIPLLVSIVGLFLTWSRSGWLFFIVSSIFIFYLFFRRKKSSFVRKGLGVLIIIIGIFFIWFASSNDPIALGMRDRVIKQSVSYDESVFQRNQLNQRAVEMYENNILTGVGAGKFIYRLGAKPIYTSEGLRIMQPAHNIFFLSAAELGFIALWIFSFFLYYTLRRLRRNIYLILPLLLILIIGNLDHYLITLPQGLLLLVIIDLIVLIRENIDN